MPKRRPRQLFAAGIIERQDTRLLIVRPTQRGNEPRLWQFPRGLVKAGESPESAMRRIAQDELRIRLEIIIGQPPLTCTIDEREAELRCFFCGLVEGEPIAGPYEETRWVLKARLCEYDYDEPSRPVVQWLLEDRPG